MSKTVANSDSILLNETLLLKRNGAPSMTSTPLRVPALDRRTPPIAKRGSLSRYSLSELSPTLSSRNSNKTGRSGGPLFASMNIRDNISMYEETKSSGLAQRIVAYKQEAQPVKHVSHQEKYGSPGLFPIVHLFKKRTPEVISPRNNDILISKKRVQTDSPPVDNSSISSRLKKKFCAYQELAASKAPKHDDGLSSLVHLFKTKTSELMTPQTNGTVNNNNNKKRERVDSVSLENSTSPTKKKFCVYEFAASKSSTDYSFLPKKRNLKRKSTSTSTEPQSQPKQIRLINAETQTPPPVNEDKITTSTKVDAPKGPARVREPIIKVFDDKPLDAIRKDRLAALICNMTGKSRSALLIPKEILKEENKAKDEPEKLKTEKIPAMSQVVTQQPISILSKPKSGSETESSKSDKHVHFNISTESSQAKQQPFLTQTSTSIVSPIMSDSVSKSTSSSTALTSNTKPFKFPSFTSSEVTASTSSTSSTTSASSSVSAISFGDGGSSVVPNSKPSNEPIVSASITSGKTTSSAGGGGFKFDLKTHSVPQSSAPSVSFLSSPNASMSTKSDQTSVNKSVTPAFSFTKPDTDTSITNYKFGTTTSSTATVTTSAPTFSFGTLSKSKPVNFGVESKQTGPNFGASNVQPSPTVSVPSSLFSDSPKSMSAFGVGSFGSSNVAAIKPAPFAFGSSPTVNITTTAAPATAATTTTSSSVMFGNSGTFGSSTTQAFGTVINTTPSNVTFGSNAPQFSFAGSPSTTTSAMFGSTSSTPSTKPLVVFGSTPTTNAPSFAAAPNSSVPSFGSTSTTTSSKPLVVFGSTPTTNAPSFGSTTTLSAKPLIGFGAVPTTSAPTFGGGSITATAPAKPLAIFGAAPTTNALSFGNSPNTTFGTSSSGGFGSSGTGSGAFKFSTPTANVSAFGNTPQLTFGSTAATSASTFGSSGSAQATTQAPPAFGTSSTTTGGTFGSLVSITTANPPSFGSTTSGAFGATTHAFKFGSSTNMSPGNLFGSSSDATTTVANTGTFGTGAVFNSSQGFNSGSSAFGTGGGSSNFAATAAPMFGTTTTTVSAFGQSDSKPTFTFGASQPKTTSVFGPTSGTSSFGTAAGTSSFGTAAGTASEGGFGASGTFGSAKNTSAFGNQTQQGAGPFNFNSSATASSAPFSFGSAASKAEPPKPSFNFTGGAAGTSFGSNNAAPSFGGNAPSFVAPFGAAAPQPAGVFNIGTGATARPRTLRAKRRT